MLGVMTIRKEELKFREYDRYRGYYCGLCRAIKERCGSLSRMALSYEMTFLCMLLTSLYEQPVKSMHHRCAVHPMKKQLMLGSDAIDYCADLSALTAYYDLRDGWDDERRADRLAESALMKRAAQKAEQRRPRQAEAVRRYVKALREVERSGQSNLDAAANLTGEMLAELYAMNEQDLYARDLREMGYYIGKFIYLCDSYEDIERDRKKKNYNPLLPVCERESFAGDCEQMLSDMMARACRAFERLPVIEDAEIMRNVLYSGIWLRFEHATEQRRKAKSKQ